MPILSRTPTSSTDVPGRATADVSGSHVWTGTIGALMAKATMKVAKTRAWAPWGSDWDTWASVSKRKKSSREPGAGAVAHRATTPPSMTSPPKSE